MKGDVPLLPLPLPPPLPPPPPYDRSTPEHALVAWIDVRLLDPRDYSDPFFPTSRAVNPKALTTPAPAAPTGG